MMNSNEVYFKAIDVETNKVLDTAKEARKKGFDPADEVEVPLTRNLAERVEGLISVVAPQIRESGVVQRINELEKKYGFQDWRVALSIALEVAQEKFCKFKDKREAMEVGIRVGFAYVTVGVVVSPLEGFVKLQINKRKDGGEYFCLFYSGPVRSAGGTAASSSVLIADYVRKKMGYKEYDPTEVEIKRTVTEVFDYHEKVTNLQYFPSEEEIIFLLKHLPVQINGDPSEKYEVSNYKDLERIETNIIRNGVALVIAECLSSKATKILKQLQIFGRDFDLEHWNFLEKFVDIQKKLRAKKEITAQKDKLMPDYNYIHDLVAGRPVFTHPLAKGGFRLRYGRARNSGLSSQAVHPATMVVLENFIAVGTQLKVERPGKATVIASCNSIEGPIVKLNNGSVVFLESEEEAKKVVNDVEEVIYLGDLLINYGDFLNRAHVLVPVGYCEEWWRLEAGVDKDKITIDEAIDLCKNGKPLHPRYCFHWSEINKDQFVSLINWLKKSSITDDKLILPYSYDVNKDLSEVEPKRVIELLGIPHKLVSNEHVVIENPWAKALMFSLGNKLDVTINKENVLDIINELSGVLIRDKSGTTIGARMGRPEKAKMRKLTGSPQILFPVGKEGGKMRCFQSCLEKGIITAEFAAFFCENCKKETIYRVCEFCGGKIKNNKPRIDYKKKALDINFYFKHALDIIKTKNYPNLIKGVRGTSNVSHITEHLVKGILRAMYNLYVNKDGTIRYDMTETCITHFTPKEIGTNINRLRGLGYDKDYNGNDLVNEDQILEIKVQDVILPSCDDSLDEKADDVMINVANFIDDCLEKLYGMNKYYNIKKRDDLIGHLIMGMSPHTSAGVVGRIIGFSKTQGFYCHPYFHCLMRRDCDGDEAGIILLMDVLLNFSRYYIPGHRGAKQDEALVLSSKIIPSEVDDMVFDMDIVDHYPLELYLGALEFKYPWEVKIKKVKDVLNTPEEYQGFKFTHNTTSINSGVMCSSYKKIPLMMDKVEKQMKVAEKVRAVNESDVARLIIEKHFIRDLKGNLRKFSMQQFRCVDCNEKFRRPPLSGKCKCGGRIIFTISEGSVIKYLEPSLFLAEKYDLPAYLKQNLDLTKKRIESYFGKLEDKQEGLIKWFK